MNRLDDWSGDSPWAIPAAFAPTSTCHKLFTAGSDGKESAYSAGGPGSIPGRGDPLKKGMATHSRILAWRIPWTEEPVGLQSVGLQRVRRA